MVSITLHDYACLLNRTCIFDELATRSLTMRPWYLFRTRVLRVSHYKVHRRSIQLYVVYYMYITHYARINLRQHQRSAGRACIPAAMRGALSKEGILSFFLEHLPRALVLRHAPSSRHDARGATATRPMGGSEGRLTTTETNKRALYVCTNIHTSNWCRYICHCILQGVPQLVILTSINDEFSNRFSIHLSWVKVSRYFPNFLALYISTLASLKLQFYGKSSFWN